MWGVHIAQPCIASVFFMLVSTPAATICFHSIELNNVLISVLFLQFVAGEFILESSMATNAFVEEKTWKQKCREKHTHTYTMHWNWQTHNSDKHENNGKDNRENDEE